MIKRSLPLLLCLVLMISVGAVCAIWQFAQDKASPEEANLPFSTDGFRYPEMVYITNAEHISGNGTYTNAGYYDNVLTSSVTVPKGTELTFRITVFNNTYVEQGFDAVITNATGYDNGNITFTLTNLKRPYTVDGVMADDVTRIPAQQKYQYEITFKFTENTTDFSTTVVTFDSIATCLIAALIEVSISASFLSFNFKYASCFLDNSRATVSSKFLRSKGVESFLYSLSLSKLYL